MNQGGAAEAASRPLMIDNDDLSKRLHRAREEAYRDQGEIARLMHECGRLLDKLAGLWHQKSQMRDVGARDRRL